VNTSKTLSINIITILAALVVFAFLITFLGSGSSPATVPLASKEKVERSLEVLPGEVDPIYIVTGQLDGARFVDLDNRDIGATILTTSVVRIQSPEYYTMVLGDD
jgi:hypothetical protein